MIKIITYADNHNNANLDILRSKLNIEILPKIEENFQLYHKTIAVNNYIKNLSEDTVILFLDAFDVLPVNGVNRDRLEYAIRRTFDLSKITFNSEVLCSPQDSYSSYFDHIPTEWKYLNSGMYCGKAGVLKPIIESIIDKYLKNLPKNMRHLCDCMGDFNDQLNFIKYYSEDSSSMALDYSCKIFQTLFCGYIGCEPYHKLNIDLDNKIIYNPITKTYPLLVHGNGKVIMDKILQII